jgi:hypothetical protein
MVTKNIHFKSLILPHRTITRFGVHYRLQQHTQQYASVVKPRTVQEMRFQKQRANTIPYPPAVPATPDTNTYACTKQDYYNLTSYPEGTWTCTVGTWKCATYFGSTGVTLYFP